jgi:hypothetical protein
MPESEFFKGLAGPLTGIITGIGVALIGLFKHNGDLKKLADENVKLKSQLHIMTDINPQYSLSAYGFYESQGHAFCGNCRSSVTHERIPLNVLAHPPYARYECPQCKTVYQAGKPPVLSAGWNPHSF